MSRDGNRAGDDGSDTGPRWTDGDDLNTGELHPGDEEAQAAGPDANPEQLARTICLRLLTTRPRTRSELATALAKRNIPAEAADAVLDRFGEVGLIDDAAFARAWVETRQRGRGLGRSALAGELRKKGVDREIVQEALDQIDPSDDLDAARRLVEKKLAATRGQPADKRARRLVGMLARRGHPAGVAYRVVREALAAEGSDPDLSGVPDPTLADD
ncbi:regulatory protein RecX [Cryptosporangium phraense]|uniref:regulatory protein RecX n=1 Tax=Cryptosporangium phraense TaxID=2593070 RepID=UPI001F118318|nr:regulatory protein RecX [Cryptosporangium phraense]